MFAEQQLIDEARASEQFRREMAEAKSKERSSLLEEEERAREAERERELEEQRQQRLDAARAAEKAEEERMEEERARREAEEAAEQRLLESAKVVAWPSAMGLKACNVLSLCDDGLVLRRLVEECSTTDPPPRSDVLQDLMEQMALDGERDIARRMEEQRLRREQDESVRAMAEAALQDILEEVVGDIVDTDFCEQARREMEEDEGEEKGWRAQDEETGARKATREGERERMRAARQAERDAARAARKSEREQMREKRASDIETERLRCRQQEISRLEMEIVQRLEDVERRRLAEADPLGLGGASKKARSTEEQEAFDKEMEKQLGEGISRWDAQRKEEEESAIRQEEMEEEEREKEEDRAFEEAERRAREVEEQEDPEERAEREAQERRDQEREARRRQRREERREQDREIERLRAEARGIRTDSTPPSPIPPPPPPAAPEDMRREAYVSVFGLAGTSPLHALCMNACVNEELMGDVVQGMCHMQVWVGGENGGVWSGEENGKAGGLVGLMAMCPCDHDAGRLPLHATCVNGSCSSAVLACKTRPQKGHLLPLVFRCPRLAC